MHREPGFYVVDRPIGYALTAAGEGVALAVQARDEREAKRKLNNMRRRVNAAVRANPPCHCAEVGVEAGCAVHDVAGARAAAPLGRSPAVLPSRKQAAASEPTAPSKAVCTALLDCECRDCKAERCQRCRLLLKELSTAVFAFSAENGPFVRAYAHLTYQQVHEGKQRLEMLGKAVRVAQNRFREHTRDHH